MYPAIIKADGVEVCFTRHAVQRSLQRGICTHAAAVTLAVLRRRAGDGKHVVHDAGICVVARVVPLTEGRYFWEVITMFRADEEDAD